MDIYKDCPLLVGLTGLKAAGKDEMARYLKERHGFASYRFSDAVRAEAAKRGIENPAVEQLIEIGNWGRSQPPQKEAYWAVKLLELAQANGHAASKIVVNGIRHPAEIMALSYVGESRFGPVVSHFAAIVAPTMLRADRFLKRRQAGDGNTLESFLALDDADRGIGQPPDGQQVDRSIARVADGAPWAVYNNAGSLEEFHAWIERYLGRVCALAGISA